jgi:alginate O-acetyltransferase complex protein AlgI
MVFTSTVFLFAFLPLALLLFYVVPARWRAAPLLLMSAVFYAWGEPVLVVLILLTAVFTYAWGHLLLHTDDESPGRRRAVLLVGVAVVLVPITVFKYLHFVLATLGLSSVANDVHLPLPIGVSFYTFMAIGYLIDIYRRRDGGAPSLLQFSGFLTMFPHLVAGPIVRWSHVGPQLARPRFQAGMFGYGALRVAGGLVKKAVLSDSIAVVVDGMFATGSPTSTGAAWVATLLYSLQIYLDFSAYSDIAIGLAAMMGVHFDENFRYPYVSRSAREFWQRWHISLGSWFRDYLYIPLGGSRVRPLVLWRNLLVVWAVTGLWHGAAWTFILWGTYFGVLIGLERTVWGRAVERTPAPVQHVYGLLVAVLGWVLFRSTDLHQAGSYYLSMAGLGDGPAWDAAASFAIDRTWVMFAVGALLAAGVLRPFMDRVQHLLEAVPPPHLAAAAGTSGSGAATHDRPAPAAPVTSAPAAVPTSEPDGAAVATLAEPVVGSSVAMATTTEETTESATGAVTEARPGIGFGLAALLVVVVAVLTLVATAFVVATTYSPFIYFRF